MDKAIVVEDVHISYQTIKNIKSGIGKLSFSRRTLQTFEAVKGVSFSVEEGAIVGLIGKNGSGKSTLLRAVAGIFNADKGHIELGGRTAALLSLGVGFQPKLSGRDNIILSGLMMGFRKKQILAKMNDIIEFSELEEFIDMPVQSYSSGMYSKLAFSITATLESEILLIDEVLSVGDQHFKEKSYARMRELIADQKRTVILVSHSMETIRELCSHVIWLHEGRIVKEGTPEVIIPEYREFMKK